MSTQSTFENEYLLEYNINYLYHMTNISNLSSIFQHGLLSHNDAHKLTKLTDISNGDVQTLRKGKIINNIPLHSYVPFYFSIKNPMLSYLRDIQANIVFIGIDPLLLLDPNTIFSDGNAAANNTKFYQGVSSLSQLPWNIINAHYWNEFEDGKRIKCAEVLVYPRVSSQSFLKIFCYSNKEIYIIQEALPTNVTIQIQVKQDLYF